MIRRPLFIVGFVLIVLLAAVGVALAADSPERAVHRYFTATYDGWRAYRDLRIEVRARSWDRATVRVVARFQEDPDYGPIPDDDTWYEYVNELEVVRQGGRWLPTRGTIKADGSTFNVFNAYWVASDPARERVRAAPSAACPCTEFLKPVEGVW